MNLSLPLPSLTAETPREQLQQLCNYLRQTVTQLNWAMGQLSAPLPQVTAAPQAKTGEAAATFAQIKGLIIRSSEIAQAFSDHTLELLRQQGEYLAAGDFGTYQEQLSHSLTAELTGIRQEFSRVETVVGQLYSGQRSQNSYLRFGQVGTSLAADADLAPGIEIGDFLTLAEGQATTVRQRFARFTAYGLELFGSDRLTPIAWISDRQLCIRAAEISQLRMGHFITEALADGSTVKRWIKED